MFRSISKNKSAIYKRSACDDVTKKRLKYNPFYLSFDKQEGSRVWVDGREMIMMSSNDYLGLSMHPKVIAAGKKALEEWGSSTTGARLANGSRSYHLSLEEKLASFLGKEACHVTSAGYLSCMSSIASFSQKGDLILVDRNVHSSLWSGIQGSLAKVERFGHNNPSDLKDVLSYEDNETSKLMVFEGVYSMEGHIAPLREFVEIAQDNNCFTVMDDAHGFGVLGEEGRGTASHFGVTDQIDVICGSLSKSLSSTGGFIAADKVLIDFIRTHSKQTIFSAAISPSQAACAEAALGILQSEPEHWERLWENTKYYASALKEIGVDTWSSETPAVPLLVGSTEKAYKIWKNLLKEGVFSVLAVAPAVPPGKDLIRTAISARHSREDIDFVVEKIQKVFSKHF